MSSVFRFKQFNIEQAGCAMKVNTDAVLLAALASVQDPGQILDVGTGTGVISLMLAQRFPDAFIEGVEADESASGAAALNFTNSAFASRLRSVHSTFEKYFEDQAKQKYDLIISNPPFFINSLKSADPVREMARHTNSLFFENLISLSAVHLNSKGSLSLILPMASAELVKSLSEAFGLNIHSEILICSFKSSEPHRNILTLGLDSSKQAIRKFVIYQQHGIYSDEYADLLKDFLTIF